MKQRFYDISNLLNIQAQYNLLLGERSNGKSFQVKKHAIERFFSKGSKSIYLRRFTVEVKPNMVEEYFNDIDLNYDKLTNGKYAGVMCYRGLIYFYSFNENGEKIKGESFGKYMALSTERQTRSLSLSEYDIIIYEEFNNPPYLDDECKRLMHLVSTVARRRSIQVFLVGNTVSRLCPYFSEWQLVNIPKQNFGDIDIYNINTNQFNEDGSPVIVKIAVELCANSGSNSKMFFGNASKMITNGVWEADEHPHLLSKYRSYTLLYKLTIVSHNMMYVVELLQNDARDHILFVHPTSQINTDRVITNEWAESLLFTDKLIPVCKGDKAIINLIKKGKICYSDNLTGSEFLSILKDIL